MTRLEEDFPELQAISPTWQVFKIGEEPPAYLDWIDFTPQQRLRYLELQRRISFGYDPDSTEIPRTARFVEPGER